jgi:uncharacterized protein YecT (DUF1311 family)
MAEKDDGQGYAVQQVYLLAHDSLDDLASMTSPYHPPSAMEGFTLGALALALLTGCSPEAPGPAGAPDVPTATAAIQGIPLPAHYLAEGIGSDAAFVVAGPSDADAPGSYLRIGLLAAEEEVTMVVERRSLLYSGGEAVGRSLDWARVVSLPLDGPVAEAGLYSWGDPQLFAESFRWTSPTSFEFDRAGVRYRVEHADTPTPIISAVSAEPAPRRPATHDAGSADSLELDGELSRLRTAHDAATEAGLQALADADCRRAPSQVELGWCYEILLEREEAAVERAFGLLLSRLDAYREVDHGPADPPPVEEWRATAERAQRAWRAVRDADCMLVASTFYPGSGGDEAESECRARLTRDRAKMLRDGLDWSLSRTPL